MNAQPSAAAGATFYLSNCDGIVVRRNMREPETELRVPFASGQMKNCEAMTRILLSRPWSDDDINALRKLWADGVPVRKLALRFRRSQSAIRGKAVQLGLKRPIQAARPLPEGQMHAH